MLKIVVLSLTTFFLLATWLFYDYTNHSDIKISDITSLNDDYSRNIQPIFTAKCIACHSCFNSPCQLNLTSFAGVNRGANKISIYDFPKIEARQPTRLYIDGHSKKEWRNKSFYSVTNQKEEISILDHLVNRIPGIESGLQKKYTSEESRVCLDSTKPSSLESYTETNPAGRMPYGLPPLNKTEIVALRKWQKNGSLGPQTQMIEAKIIEHRAFAKKITSWENFFNQKSLQAQISSRYIYEHLFLASIFFESSPHVFFRLIRSKTKTGTIEEIGTSYPFDYPGPQFYYRLRPVVNEIVHKSHIPFAFNNHKRELWNKNFYKSKWKTLPERMPPYGAAGANPFKTFSSIPAKSRYQFFLDEAGYHVMTFIKGPVCRGQTALNVINDHFWVLFLDPEKDPLVLSGKLHGEVAQTMSFPSGVKDDFSPAVSFRDNYWSSSKKKFSYLSQNSNGLDKNSLWDGDKKNTNAILTIYRHFDSSTVLRGARGRIPKTVWVLDYHVFESIYYNLSAGYNVFGPLLHQLNSRLYMEISRISAEDFFLSFMPKESRLPIRESWNKKTPSEKNSFIKDIVELVSEDVKEKMTQDYPYLGLKIPSNANISVSSPKIEFIDQLFKNYYSPSIVKRDYDLRENKKESTDIEKNKHLTKLIKLNAKITQYLPDSILLRYNETIYTLIHNKGHFNVSMLLFEDDRRDTLNDSLDVIPGVATSYVNLFMNLNEEQMESFVKKLEVSQSASDVWDVLSKYSVSRSSKDFWKNYQWFSKRTKNKVTNEEGWLDLNRYLNI